MGEGASGAPEAAGGTAPVSAEALRSRDAGDKIIRGGALRSAGYLAGVGLVAAASVVLTRHLGVGDFGRFTTVMALIAIATALADAGLTTIGQREYAASPTGEGQRAVVAGVLGARLLLTPLAVGAVAVFGLAAGYGATMVLGILVAGLGLVLTIVALTYTLPLSVELRLGALTVTELVHKVVLVAAILVLVAVGAGLLPFFAANVVAGLGMLVVTLVLVGRGAPAPAVRPSAWLGLVREAAPMALALVINQVYVRLLVVLVSLVGTEAETGLFSASFRVTEVFLGLPLYMVGAAFPLLAQAGVEDEPRLAYALQRLAEVALLVGGGIAIALAVGAEPVIAVVGGEDYAEAADALRWQAIAIVGAALTQLWTLALVAVRRQAALITVNLVALAGAIGLGLALVPPFGEEGAGIAAAAGELLLAATALVALVRARPALRPAPGRAGRLLVAAALALLALLLPVPPVVQAAVALAVYAGVALALRAVPGELLVLLRGGGPPEAGAPPRTTPERARW